MAEKSRVLVIGAAGYIGKFIVEASVKAGHSTYALLRRSTVSNPEKLLTVQHFQSLGINILFGDLHDHESLVRAIKQVDVVISTVGHAHVADQHKLIPAIKEAGNVKRFFPSEFGNDVERVDGEETVKKIYEIKTKIRRGVEAEGIPYTFVSSYFCNFYFLNNLVQPGFTSPPTDKLVILGDGNLKAIFNYEKDIAKYTIRAVDDPRTINKVLYIRPAGNIYSFNELVSLWERKIGKAIERVYVPEDQQLKNIQEAPDEYKLILSVNHSVFVKGAQNSMDIEPAIGVEASKLYPDINYTSVDNYLNQFL